MSAKSIAVFGGNGFLGRKICEVGVKLGYNVTSFSRSGKPPPSLAHTAWARQVNWDSADLLDPNSYSSKLSQYGSVVHSVGMLFENQSYKKVVNSNFNILNDVQNLANTLKGANPMEKNSRNTFEALQRDSAVLLADAFIKAKEDDPSSKPAFVYISADQKPPIVPERYLTTKREAEFELTCKQGLRAILLRPAFMYESGSGVNARTVFSELVQLGYNVKKLTLGDSVSYVNNLVKPRLSTEQVALKLYEKLEDPEFSGVVHSEGMIQKRN